MSKCGPLLMLVSVSFGSLASLGCTSGTETGNPPVVGTVSLGLAAFSSAPESASFGMAQGGLLVDRMRLNIASLSLVPCDSARETLELSAGDYDLLAPRSEEVEGDLELCSLRVALEPSTGESPELPLGTAIYLHGVRADASEFEVLSGSPQSLELNAAAGAPFGTEPLLLGFDVGVWFQGVDVHGAHSGADGIARLDTTLNPDLLALFEAQLGLSAALYVDSDANGHVDPADGAPVAAAQ